MQQKKVMIAANAAWNLVNFRAGLIRALVSEGHAVIAVASDDAYSARLSALGCRFLPIKIDNQGTSPLADLRLFSRFAAILSKERPDAYLGYTIKPNIYGSLAAHALGIPTINNVSGLGTAFIRDTWLTRIVKPLYRLALSRSHNVFFQNEDDRTLFLSQKLVAPEKTALLPGSGVDLGHFQPVLARQPSQSTIRFLFVARLIRDKGLVEYVDAARAVRRQHPNAVFQVLGFLDENNPNAIDRGTIERWVAEQTIEYLRGSDDVRPFVAAADCIVLPSYREGTPRALLEAAAMAKPLIATNVPGCREVVFHGENGFLCAPQDARDLAARMEEFLMLSRDERLAMGASSLKLASTRFDERIVIQAYLRALESLFPPH